MHNKLVLSIGSNSKDRDWQMENGIKWLKTQLHSVTVSPVYNTPAANGRDSDYLNAVLKAKTSEDYDTLNDMLKKYEAVCGRTPISKQVGEIPMDLDIVIWNEKVIRERDFQQEYFQKGWHLLEK